MISFSRLIHTKPIENFLSFCISILSKTVTTILRFEYGVVSLAQLVTLSSTKKKISLM